MSPRRAERRPGAKRAWRILVPTRLAPEGLAILRAIPGARVDSRPGIKGAVFAKALATADAVVIRSEHKLDARTIKVGKRLRLIARAGVGVENVDLQAAGARGIVVINTPAANSIAVAELVMAMMLALARKIAAADRAVKSGGWNRSAYAGHELFGKTLGLIGFGRIGRAVAHRAAAFGMDVITFDPFISPAAAEAAEVRLVKLPVLLRDADVVSLHLPLSDATRGLIGAAQLRRMKPSALLINAARGGIVDETALARALRAGRIAGCGLDVYASEPPADRWFAGMDNVIATPHLGALTSESQTKVGIEIADAVRLALTEGVYRNAVNLPIADASDLPRLQPYIDLAERMGRLLRALGAGPVNALTLELGAQTTSESKIVAASALKGLLSAELDEPVTLVNAQAIAASRHLEVAVVDHGAKADEATQMTMTGRFGRQKHRVVGVVESGDQLKIRQIDDFGLDISPEGRVLVFTNRDRPGVIGAAGAVLGHANINIASWILGRRRRGGKALAVVTVDDPVPAVVLKELGTLPNMENVTQVDWE